MSIEESFLNGKKGRRPMSIVSDRENDVCETNWEWVSRRFHCMFLPLKIVRGEASHASPWKAMSQVWITYVTQPSIF